VLFVLCVETDPSRAADPAQLAQVFPPRPGQPPSPPTPPQSALQQSTPPGMQTQSVPLAAILGDPTRSFIRLVNMQGPTESTYTVGRGLAGRVYIERQVRDVGQGAKTYLHVSGLSNPPSLTPQGNELRLRFLFPLLVFRTFYREYTAEGDTALGDVAAANVTADVYLTPIADQRGLPAIQGVRVVFDGAISPPERCIYLFDLVYAVNVCGLANDYLKDIKLTLENGIREGLMQPQARTEFERAMLEFLRGDLLARSGLNPAGGQLDIVQAVFRGTDYVVSFVARP
jgi:hypothetical protein